MMLLRLITKKISSSTEKFKEATDSVVAAAEMAETELREPKIFSTHKIPLSHFSSSTSHMSCFYSVIYPSFSTDQSGRTQYAPLMKMASGAVVSGMTSGDPANKA